MVSYYIADNYDLWAAYDREQSRKLARLPVCADCGEPIQQEDAVYINEVWLCDDCLDSYRRSTEICADM